MHVLQLVTSWTLGGVQAEVHDLVRRLEEQGHTVTVVALYGVDRGYARALASPLVDVGMTSSRPGQLLSGLAALRQVVRVVRPDVVHTHAFHATLMGRVVCRVLGVPVVSTTHSTIEGHRLHALLSRATFSWSAATTAVSAAVRRAQEEQHAVPRGRMRVLHNGVDLDRLRRDDGARARLRGELLSEPDGLLLLSVGRLHPVKDHPMLLRAFAAVLQELPHAKLAIVGDGPLGEDLQALAFDLGIERSVRLLGRRADVPQLLSAADLLVLSSRWEGLGLVLLEAMACEVPVVTTATGGTTEVVHDIWPATPVGDPAALARAVTAVLRLPPDERAERTGRALARVRSTFDIEDAATEWGHLYRQAVVEHSSGAAGPPRLPPRRSHRRGRPHGRRPFSRARP